MDSRFLAIPKTIIEGYGEWKPVLKNKPLGPLREPMYIG